MIGREKYVYENCGRDREWAEKQKDYVNGERRVKKQLLRCIWVVCSSSGTGGLLPFRLLWCFGASLVAQMIKNLPAMWETWVFLYLPIFAWTVPLVSLIFLKKCLVFPILMFSSISLHWSLRKLSYPSLLFFGTQHSNGYIFPFLLCL